MAAISGEIEFVDGTKKQGQFVLEGNYIVCNYPDTDGDAIDKREEIVFIHRVAAIRFKKAVEGAG